MHPSAYDPVSLGGTMKMKEYIPVKLEPLSPVHIGSGQELDPFSYIIREDAAGTPFLYFIDVTAWIESQDDPKALTNYFATHGFADVRKFLYERIEDPSRYALAIIPVMDKKIAETYKRVILDKRPENRMLLDPALKNPVTYGLIIPGSSLKGAIRTAILDYLYIKHDKNLKEKREKFGPLDREIFGTPKESTFKALKISDFEAPPGEAFIVSAKEKSKNETKQPTPKDNCEITHSFLMNKTPYGLYGTLVLGFQNQGQGKLVVKRFKESFDFERLCAVVTDFYKKRFMDEWKKFYTLPHFKKTAEALAPLREMIEKKSEWNHAMLLRVGHYSHIESVTISNNRPRTRKRKDGQGFYPYGTTRTLANGVFPFGWVRLVRITEEEYRQGMEGLEKRKGEVLEARTRTERELQVAKETAEAERRRREEERRRKEEEKKKAKEAFEALPEYQKRVLKIQDDKTADNLVMTYYRELDQFEGEEKRAIASALKERWMKEGRWKVAKKKKQYEKVQTVKEILGEV